MIIPGKVVLITGASRGIGAACAQAFASRSAQLSLTARSSIPQPVRQASTLVTAGDITDPEARSRIVEATLERFGRIDILINNAGQGAYRPAHKAPEAETRALFELNVFAPLAMAQLVVPHMRRQGSGTIVNIGSIAGRVSVPWMTIYSSTKFALGALSDGLRMELRPHGIHVMNVCPGYVKTPFQEHALGAPPEAITKGKPFAISAQRCAEAIARGVERDARTVVTPSALGWLFIWLGQFVPTMVESRLTGLAQ